MRSQATEGVRHEKSEDRSLLVTVPAVAEMLSISPRSVWRLLASGELPTVRIGRGVRIPRKSVIELAERGAR